MAAFTPSASPALVTVTDRQDRKYSGFQVGDQVILHDHYNGSEVAKVDGWQHAAAILSALQY